MKIWLDISNSPHVNFFLGMIRELSHEHEFVITTRPLANTIDLLKLHDLEYHIVGRHYGKSSVMKMAGFVVRVAELRRFVRKLGIDAAICHSSYYLPVCAKSLGVPSIYLNDNEHAEGNRLAFLFADRIMVPEFFSDESLSRQWANAKKVIRYPGVKEGIYLWNQVSHKASDAQNKLRDKKGRELIVIRPEPSYAQYYSGKDNFLDQLIMDLVQNYRVMLLPRGDDQFEHYRKLAIAGLEIPDKPITLTDFQRECDVFIGAGGTMTRESAVLGIPTISVYQDDLLAVDRYLVECGAMVHNPNANLSYVQDFVDNTRKEQPHQALLAKGRQAHALIRDSLLEIARN